MKKKSEQWIMIMGAGIYQVPLIKTAKKMGLNTLVVSIEGDYPGIGLADVFLPLDTKDREGVLQYAQKYGISGICTSGTDVAVQTIGYVNTHMGLKGISWEAAQKVTDKFRMKEAFHTYHVATARYAKAASYEQAKKAADEIGYPVIIKIVDSSGSRGVIKVKEPDALQDIYQKAMSVTHKDYLIIEEFIEAKEIGVDGFVGEDGLELFLPHEKYTYTVDGVTVPMGHAFPFHADEELLQELEKQIRLSVKALGLKNCPFNADVFVKDHQVWIIEMGGRTGATCIPELISIYKGYDWYEKLICSALGEKVSYASEESNPCMAKLLFAQENGIITDIHKDVIENLKDMDVDVQVDYEIGKKVETMKNATDRIGHLIVKGEDEMLIEQYLGMLREAVEIAADSRKN